MKTITTKKLFTFILLMSGMFSFTVADAQCPGNKVRVYHCYLQGNAWQHIGCQSKCVDPNNIPLYWFPGDCHPNPCSGERLANEPADGEFFTLAVSPNPVAGSSVIYFFMEQSEKASLNIFDVNGRLVTTLADKIFEEGENEIVWNAADVNAGIYFLRMETAGYSENQKLIVAK